MLNLSCIYHIDSVESTNTFAKELAVNGAPHATVIIAGEQTNGRGRLGRTFFSVPGSIFMSFIMKRDYFPHWDYATIFAVLAVSRAIEDVCKKTVTIKWVNDILYNDKKICGILCESQLSDWLVIGAGVNLTVPADGFPDSIKGRAGALYENGKPPKEALTAAIIEYMLSCADDETRIKNEYNMKIRR